MKSLKQLFEEMGFNPSASLETQKAFFKNLAAAANATSINKKVSQKSSLSEPEKNVMAQLEFDFSDSKQVS